MSMNIRIRRVCLLALAAINKIKISAGKLNATTATVLLDHPTTNLMTIFPPSNSVSIESSVGQIFFCVGAGAELQVQAAEEEEEEEARSRSGMSSESAQTSLIQSSTAPFMKEMIEMISQHEQILEVSKQMVMKGDRNVSDLKLELWRHLPHV